MIDTKLILVEGIPGTGKTTLCQRAAALFTTETRLVKDIFQMIWGSR